MAKVTITFQLPEEKFDHALAIKAYDMYRVILDIRDECRKHSKYDKKMRDCFEEIERIAYEIDLEVE
jgi:hypothetical protein